VTVRIAALVHAAELEAAREFTICNACRYCEGYCAVFPAMTRRLDFARNDLHYLANLCHNCGACLNACQYAPPHEFAVSLPRALAEVRGLTYSMYAWPQAFAGLYRKAGVYLALSLAAGLALFLLLAMASSGGLLRPANGGNFYAVFPHRLLVTLFGLVFAYDLLALAVGVARFWNAWQPGPGSTAAALEATRDVFTLKYLGGGGAGCNDQDDRFTLARRRFHHLTFYGFLLCFASTSVATLYHYAWGLPAPYAMASLPVILGALGGVGLVIGAAGLLMLKMKRDRKLADPAQQAMDLGFICLLFLSGASGLILLAMRDTPAMGALLAIHLGIVMALFLTLPYGKFAHGVYRGAALLKWAIEKRQPSRLRLDES
jgi:citrate/tricarballylate utilization protein